MTEKEKAKAYDEIIALLEKQGKQTNERAWLYLVSDVLTWKDGIGQYLDGPRVQELAKVLYNKYAQKLYNPSNTDKIESKFKVGDWVVRGDTVVQILDIQEQYYIGLDINGKDFVSSRFLNDDKIHLWTIQNAKDGDILIYDNSIFIYNEIYGKHLIYYGIYEHNQFHDDKYYSFIDLNTIDVNDIYPATKEQRDTIMKAMNDAGYEWDAEKKELKKKNKL